MSRRWFATRGFLAVCLCSGVSVFEEVKVNQLTWHGHSIILYTTTNTYFCDESLCSIVDNALRGEKEIEWEYISVLNIPALIHRTNTSNQAHSESSKSTPPNRSQAVCVKCPIFTRHVLWVALMLATRAYAWSRTYYMLTVNDCAATLQSHTTLDCELWMEPTTELRADQTPYSVCKPHHDFLIVAQHHHQRRLTWYRAQLAYQRPAE